MRRLIYSIALLGVLGFASCKASKTPATNQSESSNSTVDKNRKGASFEDAIVVSGISEEYKYIKENCEGCQMQEQRLVFHEGKPYDILVVKPPRGKSLEYYFDISSFYGKW